MKLDENHNKKQNTIILFVISIIIIGISVLFEHRIEERISIFFTPKTEYYAYYAIEGPEGEIFNSGDEIGDAEIQIEPFTKALTVVFEIIIGVILVQIYIFVKYKEGKSSFVESWIGGVGSLLKIVFLLGMIYGVVYVFYAKSFDITSFLTSAEESDDFRYKLVRAIYNKREEIYIFTQISGAFLIPFDYCIAKETSIYQKSKETKIEELETIVIGLKKDNKNFNESNKSTNAKIEKQIRTVKELSRKVESLKTKSQKKSKYEGVKNTIALCRPINSDGKRVIKQWEAKGSLSPEFFIVYQNTKKEGRPSHETQRQNQPPTKTTLADIKATAPLKDI